MLPMPLVFLTLSILLSLSLVLAFFLHPFHRSSTCCCPHVFSLIPLSMLLSPLCLRRPIFHVMYSQTIVQSLIFRLHLNFLNALSIPVSFTHISFPTSSPFQSACRRFHSPETAL